MIAAFEQLSKPLSNNTELNDFLSEYFGAAGSELAPVPSEDLTTDPTFLEHVNSTDIRDFIKEAQSVSANKQLVTMLKVNFGRNA